VVFVFANTLAQEDDQTACLRKAGKGSDQKKIYTFELKYLFPWCWREGVWVLLGKILRRNDLEVKYLKIRS
jgi:hypothetical protein